MPGDTPITDVVNLARSYTAEEWRLAGHRAASFGTEEICRAIYRCRLADHEVMPEEKRTPPIPTELSESLGRIRQWVDCADRFDPLEFNPNAMRADLLTVLAHFG